MTGERNMRPDDADAVREVDAMAFYDWDRGVRGDRAVMYKRTPVNLLTCLEKDPQGCFVAEEGGRVVGFILSRTWGGVGWAGTFGVLPEYQGRGIGKRLLSLSLEYLRRDPDRAVGLETMAGSGYNLGLYLKQGFRVRFPVVLLHKELGPPTTEGPGLPRWSSAGGETKDRWLADLRQATGRITPRLDYSKELLSMAEHGLGETLVLTEDARAIGMSTVELVSRIEGWGQDRAIVQVLALDPAHTDGESLHRLVSESERLAQDHGKRWLSVAANGRHAWALEQLLAWGYRARRAGVHMILEGTDEGPAVDRCANLVRWAA